MLWDGGEVLIEQVLEGVMVSADDELAVVACEAEVAAKCPNHRRHWLDHVHLHLGRIHGNVGDKDDVAQVGYLLFPERALAHLEEVAVLAQELEDSAHMLEMLGPAADVDQDVVDEDEDEAVQVVIQDGVHQCC